MDIEEDELGIFEFRVPNWRPGHIRSMDNRSFRTAVRRVHLVSGEGALLVAILLLFANSAN